MSKSFALPAPRHSQRLAGPHAGSLISLRHCSAIVTLKAYFVAACQTLPNTHSNSDIGSALFSPCDKPVKLWRHGPYRGPKQAKETCTQRNKVLLVRLAEEAPRTKSKQELRLLLFYLASVDIGMQVVSE